jgi:phosphopantothenoylcysteine decarboxylase/phosphopantothenate--cysteine ligase
MSKGKILLKISGSIAAYKSAYLVSKLVQNGYEVRAVMSESASEFIGHATMEGLTGHAVYTDSFEPGKMMSHIDLCKWADLTLVAPATANTINKLSAGLGNNLLTSLFLAHEWNKPYLIAPAMNTKMYNHPATKKSMDTLTRWGVKILDTDTGYLACGDEGEGKLLDPDKIFLAVEHELNKPAENNLSILITSGGTKESIDEVRFISNMSSGKTAAALADHFISGNNNVTYVHAEDAALPVGNCSLSNYKSFNDLNETLKKLLCGNNFDAVIHLAAVSDYSVSSIEADGKLEGYPLKSKLSSDVSELKISLKSNFKIINKIKEYSRNKDVKLVGFKLVSGIGEKESEKKINSIFKSADSDYVVMNNISDRVNTVQQNFKIFGNKGLLESVETSKELAEKLEALISTQNE